MTNRLCRNRKILKFCQNLFHKTQARASHPQVVQMETEITRPPLIHHELPPEGKSKLRSSAVLSVSFNFVSSTPVQSQLLSPDVDSPDKRFRFVQDSPAEKVSGDLSRINPPHILEEFTRKFARFSESSSAKSSSENPY